VTPGGRRAVSASADQTLRLWGLVSGQTIRPLEGHTGSVNAVAVTPDGRQVVSGSYDKTLRLWDLESGKEIATFTGESDLGSRMGSCAGRSRWAHDYCWRRIMPSAFLAARRSRQNEACNRRNKDPAPAPQTELLAEQAAFRRGRTAPAPSAGFAAASVPNIALCLVTDGDWQFIHLGDRIP